MSRSIRRSAQKPDPERPCDLCVWENVPVTRWNKRAEGDRFCAGCEKTMAEKKAGDEAWGVDPEGNWLDDDGNVIARVDRLGRMHDVD